MGNKGFEWFARGRTVLYQEMAICQGNREVLELLGWLALSGKKTARAVNHFWFLSTTYFAVIAWLLSAAKNVLILFSSDQAFTKKELFLAKINSSILAGSLSPNLNFQGIFEDSIFCQPA